MYGLRGVMLRLSVAGDQSVCRDDAPIRREEFKYSGRYDGADVLRICIKSTTSSAASATSLFTTR